MSKMNNDLISRSTLLEKELLYVDELTGLDYILFIDPEDVKNAPAVDAVEVVRCKDCKHYWLPQGFCVHERHDCQTLAVWQNDYDFCSYGERRV